MSPAGLTEWELLTGRDGPPPPRRPLRAGPLTMVLESGDLRYLKLAGREVVRRIYAAVRDRNWGTVPAEISNSRLEIADQSFRASYTSTHRQNEIHFVWQAEIHGETDGTIRFGFDGEAKSTFERNRIGFCVLHPIRECAGAKCRALYLNGSEKELAFPDIIASEQPVRWLHDLRGLAHEVTTGVWAELRFEGDAFEMEDQRNWIDASFKTFCTPARMPFPLEIKAGTRVRQSVTLRLLEPRRHAIDVNEPSAGRPVRIAISNETRRLPSLGLGIASHGGILSARERELLGRLRLAHVRADLKLAGADWRKQLDQAAALDLPLELAIHLPAKQEADLDELAAALASMKTRLASVLAFRDGQKSTLAGDLAAVRAALAALAVPIGAGTNADLYELNLQRPPATADFIVWSMNPQVHAFDNASIAETPEAAAQQIDSARRYFPGKPLVVSPVTLRPRFNAVATGPEPPVPAGELPPQVDPRQMSLFGAAWTLAMLKALSESGATSMTFFETTGWRGIMETEAGSPLPRKFRSAPGAVFPLYHVLADLGEFAGGGVLLTQSEESSAVQSLMLHHEGRRRLLLANLQPRATQAVLTGLGFSEPLRVRRLNAATAEHAMREPDAFRKSGEAMQSPQLPTSLSLAPYELVTLDFP